jgi:hypothetical protein
MGDNGKTKRVGQRNQAIASGAITSQTITLEISGLSKWMGY